uniref:Reverse transcriptase zinc-binding domain-containing protein n=1 Tax=Anopheles arabiensis TaxID=7173 RepID=A0A182HZ38_ANOAR
MTSFDGSELKSSFLGPSVKGILDGSPNCPGCGDAVEDVEHVLFRCPRFDRVRYEMQHIRSGTAPEF